MIHHKYHPPYRGHARLIRVFVHVFVSFLALKNLDQKNFFISRFRHSGRGVDMYVCFFLSRTQARQVR